MAINVRINQKNQVTVSGTSKFIGSGNFQSEINQATELAQSAYNAANTALATKLNSSGGTITGDLYITDNLTVANTLYANSAVEYIDAGTF